MCEKEESGQKFNDGKDFYFPSRNFSQRGERLIHVYKVEKDGNKTWAWMCSVCGKIMAPHKMNVPHGENGSWRVLQTKGAASRHLGSHNPEYVNHGRYVGDITKQGKTLCKKCGNIAYNKKVGVSISEKSLIRTLTPTEDEVYYCFDCGWLKKSQTTKITIRTK